MFFYSFLKNNDKGFWELECITKIDGIWGKYLYRLTILVAYDYVVAIIIGYATVILLYAFYGMDMEPLPNLWNQIVLHVCCNIAHLIWAVKLLHIEKFDLLNIDCTMVIWRIS